MSAPAAAAGAATEMQPRSAENQNIAAIWQFRANKYRDKRGHEIYPDGSMIDWLTEHELAGKYRSSVLGIVYHEGEVRGNLRLLWHASQGWFAVLAIAIGCGLAASYVLIVSEWLYALKSGLCVDFFWLPRHYCCLHLTETDKCTGWKDWSEILVGHNSLTQSAAVIQFMTFVCASTLYAGVSGWLVKNFAPYAAGSGIPEIKTILSGVHIKNYLGPWVLLIKVIALALAEPSGMHLGKEGPFVHIGSCVGFCVGDIFPKFREQPHKQRELVSCAAGCGVAVAFAPPSVVLSSRWKKRRTSSRTKHCCHLSSAASLLFYCLKRSTQRIRAALYFSPYLTGISGTGLKSSRSRSVEFSMECSEPFFQ